MTDITVRYVGGPTATGDSVLYEGVRAAARKLHVSVAVLHLGGVTVRRAGPLAGGRTVDDAHGLDGRWPLISSHE